MLAACSNDSSNAVTLSSPNEVTEDQGTEQTPGMNSDLVTQTGSETQIETESGTETGTGTENGTGTDATTPTAIFNSVCELTALENDQNIDVTSATFAEGGPIDSGESAISIADFAGLANGYSSISTIRIGCEWSVGDNNGQDIVNGAVTVTFTTVSSDSGRPTIGLMLTNNSPVAVNMAVCGVEAKRSNIIADVATAVFAELGDISSGAAVEATGIWSRLNSLNEFDSEQFNINNVNCRYQ